MFKANNKSTRFDSKRGSVATVHQSNNVLNSSEKFTKRIDKFRDFVRKRLNKIQDMWKHKFAVNDRLPSRGQEFEVVKESLNLGTKIKNELKTLLRDIVVECADKLGAAPCRYCVVGVGDLALNFATP